MGGFIKQLIVVAEDRVGLLADISYILGKAKINIDALSVESQGSKCIIEISVKNEKKATELLANNGYQVLQQDVLVVKIKDDPGQMAQFSSCLSKAKINMFSLNLLAKQGGFDFYALKADHTAKAKRVLGAYLHKCED